MNPQDRRQWLNFLTGLRYNIRQLLNQIDQGKLRTKAEGLLDAIDDELNSLREE